MVKTLSDVSCVDCPLFTATARRDDHATSNGNAGYLRGPVDVAATPAPVHIFFLALITVKHSNSYRSSLIPLAYPAHPAQAR